MTITALSRILHKNIRTALAEGFTLQHAFGTEEAKTCCAVSANGFLLRADNTYMGVYKKETLLNLPEGALWEVINGFDSACKNLPLAPFYALGQRLRKTFMKD